MTISTTHKNKIACCQIKNSIGDLEAAIIKLYEETRSEDEGELGWYIKDNLYFYLHDNYTAKTRAGKIITIFGPGTKIELLGRVFEIQ